MSGLRDVVTKTLSKMGLYTPVVKVVNRLKTPLMARQVRKHGVEALATMDEVLSGMNVRMFLVYGTLLGAYREHGFIPYDFDLDVGVLESEFPKEHIQKILDKGFKLEKQHYVKEDGRILVETYIWKSVGIDIYVVKEEGDIWKIYSPRKHEYKEWKDANESDGFPVECQIVGKTDLERRDFLGYKLYMPVNTHEWLVDMYTDTYMTPIKNFDNDTKGRRMIFPDTFRSYRRYL